MCGLSVIRINRRMNIQVGRSRQATDIFKETFGRSLHKFVSTKRQHRFRQPLSRSVPEIRNSRVVQQHPRSFSCGHLAGRLNCSLRQSAAPVALHCSQQTHDEREIGGHIQLNVSRSGILSTRSGAAHLLPQHVAIIMDGNGRWAQLRGLPVRQGHEAGAKAVRLVIKECLEHNIAALTVWSLAYHVLTMKS